MGITKWRTGAGTTKTDANTVVMLLVFGWGHASGHQGRAFRLRARHLIAFGCTVASVLQ